MIQKCKAYIAITQKFHLSSSGDSLFEGMALSQVSVIFNSSYFTVKFTYQRSISTAKENEVHRKRMLTHFINSHSNGHIHTALRSDDPLKRESSTNHNLTEIEHQKPVLKINSSFQKTAIMFLADEIGNLKHPINEKKLRKTALFYFCNCKQTCEKKGKDCGSFPQKLFGIKCKFTEIRRKKFRFQRNILSDCLLRREKHVAKQQSTLQNNKARCN